MPRGAESQAITNTATGQADASNLMSTAQTQGAPVSQFYKNELNNPQGYGAQDLAAKLTASNQSLGGSQASAVGAGDQLAARTGNNAGLATALDQSARNDAKVGSQNALNVQTQNDQLKEQQQQGGARGLEALYGTNVGSSLKSLGLSNDSIDTWIKGAQATSKDINDNTAMIAAGMTGDPGAVANAANGVPLGTGSSQVS